MDDNSDIDMTVMALQAIAPYRDREDVKDAIQRALEYLSERQLENGGYESYSTVNSESCSQVIVDLTALGIDPATNSRFIKQEKSVLDALTSFYAGGGFCHQLEIPEANVMAMEQAYYALTAYFRFANGESSLYDMRDVNE